MKAHIYEKPLTDEEIKKCVHSVQEGMTPDKAIQFVHDMTEADKEAAEGMQPIEKIIYSIRHAYIAGFEQGLTIYNEMYKEMLKRHGADERENENETSGGVDDGTC